MKSDIRVTVVGDGKVVKTSIIMSLVSDGFHQKVPHVISEIVVSPEITGEPVTTRIIDTSPNEIEVLNKELKKADAVILVYSFDNIKTLERLETFWLPFIREAQGNENGKSVNIVRPIIIAGNKFDLGIKTNDFEEQIYFIKQKFTGIEHCFETSAKNFYNIAELFSCTQQAIIHPIAVLYNSAQKNLTEKCAGAFSRIFKLADKDRDGVLNDHELIAMQRFCFDKPLQYQECERVKKVLQSKYEDGLTNGCINEKGFLGLQVAYIENGRASTSWTILRAFGYDDHLDLRADLLNPPLFVDSDQIVELSSAGFQFLAELFLSCDLDNDGALSKSELELCFSIVPKNIWKEDFGPNENENIFLQEFLCNLLTLLYPRKTLVLLAFLGYPSDILGAIKISEHKRTGFTGKSQRKVFRCGLLGPPGCGKTSMIRALSGSPPSIRLASPQIEGNERSVVELDEETMKEETNEHRKNYYESVGIHSFSVEGVEKYLVLFEVHSGSDCTLSATLNKKFDVAAFLYDSTDPGSFEYSAKLQSKLVDPYIPCIFIETKVDRPRVPQFCNLQPLEYCKLLRLPSPRFFSVHAENIDLFTDIVKIAMNPYVYLPEVEGKKLALLLKLTAVVAVVAVTGKEEETQNTINFMPDMEGPYHVVTLEFQSDASEEDSDALESETEKDRADDDILEKEDFETPSEKRIHLAKEYLSTISKEEAAGDLENSRLTVHERISHRLKREQEEKDRKVTKTLAHLYTNAFEESKVLTLKGHRLPVTCAIISSDEKYIYSGSKDSTIIKWSAKSGRKICRIIGGKKGKAFGGHTKEILALALSTDGKYLASGGKEDVIFIWNAVNNCELLHVFKGHRGPISSLAFRSGSNTLYSASFDRTIKIWDVDSFLFIEQLFGHQDSVMCVDTLSRDRAISVGGRDRSLRLWKISEESQLVFDSKGHVGNIECCCMINENTFVTCGEDGKILLWTTSRRRPFFTQTSAHGMRHSKSENTHNHNNKANAPWVTSVASYRYSDLLASGSNTGFIKLWRLEPNKTLSSISDLPCVGYVNSLQFSASGTILVASVAQEHRLGRWEKLKNVKNCVKVFYLNPH